MQTGSLYQFGEGGGLYGDGRDAVLRNWRVKEHSFEKLAADKKTVIERFPPGCHVGVDIYLEDRDPQSNEPEFMTQWYPVGDLPPARLIELGFQPRAAAPGQRANTSGYLPSIDGENGAEEGPFIVFVERTDIWKGSPYSHMIDELVNLAGADDQKQTLFNELDAKGVAALNGLRAHLGIKALPKSKRQQQEEKLSGQSKDARSILVPVKINQWPWQGEEQSAAATASVAAKVASPKPAAAKPATSATSVPAAGGNGGTDLDTKAVELVQKALKAKGDFLTKKDLGSALMPFLAKEGDKRMPLMQRAHQNDFLTAKSGEAWIFDPATETLASKP